MIRTALLLSALLLLSCASPHAQLGRRIDRILATTDARVGVAAEVSRAAYECFIGK